MCENNNNTGYPSAAPEPVTETVSAPVSAPVPEPAPVYAAAPAPVSAPAPAPAYAATPAPAPVYATAPATDPIVESYVESAFSKGLAAAIMCEFPVASIIAIVFGSQGQNLAEEAKNLAAARGVKPSGKNIAATVLGRVGKIVGIVMTAFWGFYFLMFLSILLMEL